MLYFSEHTSYYARVQGFEFRAEDGACTALFHMANTEELYAVPVDQLWVDQLTGFIRQYNLPDWDGFHGTAPDLLDGTQFYIELAFSDGVSVQAGGYGDFPRGYTDAAAAISAHFMQLLPDDMRDW